MAVMLVKTTLNRSTNVEGENLVSKLNKVVCQPTLVGIGLKSENT